MKIKKHIFAAAVSVAALLTGLGTVSFARLIYEQLSSIEIGKSHDLEHAAKDELVKISADNDVGLITPDTSETDEVLESEENAFEPSGYYYIIGEYDQSNFSDFEWFRLDTTDYDSGETKYIAPNGSVVTGNDEDENNSFLEFTKTSIGFSHLKFVTESIKGISYEFSGRFVETGNFDSLELKFDGNDEPIPNVVLEGTLIKKRKGVEIKKADLKFGWALGC